MSLPASSDATPRQLVLVGGGHTHVQVLRRLAMAPLPACETTVVLDVPVAVYSGMVPGFVADQYQQSELEIDVVPLLRRAGARLVLAPAIGIEPTRRRLLLAGRPPLRYDALSFDVGSIVAGLELPGVREHALPTRPIAVFVRRIAELERRLAARGGAAGEARVVVVGGGAGGIEVAFTVEQRLRARGIAARVAVVFDGEQLMPGYPERLRERLVAAARRRGIALRPRTRVAGAAADAVLLEGGERLPCDALIWVTGAVSHPLFRDSGLPTDQRGFVLTRDTLQLLDHDELFAVGDCATLRDHPRTAKAGVYAVRQGPFLISNLEAHLAGRALRRYRPQNNFLTLLNLGDGTALGAKGTLAFGGRWVMGLKDWIDRRFMERFQVLTDDGAEHPAFARLPAMSGNGMAPVCGGCAAKLGQTALEGALDQLRALGAAPRQPGTVLGLERPDDAAAYRTRGGDVQVVSVDLFPAFCDDPYLVGKVAARNAVADLIAKGATPRHALAVVAVRAGTSPERAQEELFQVLAGARAAFDPLGVEILGGHTTSMDTLAVGFAVSGDAPVEDELLRLDRLAPGDALLLTKPLGTGVVLHADMLGRARGPWLADTLRALEQDATPAAVVLRAHGARAATDVTGFGLAGHLQAMARASSVALALELSAVPALPGALELLRLGLRSTFHQQNAALRASLRLEGALEAARVELLFDPQTAGGLVAGVPAHRAAGARAALAAAGFADAAVIGRVLAAPAGAEGALLVSP